MIKYGTCEHRDFMTTSRRTIADRRHSIANNMTAWHATGERRA